MIPLDDLAQMSNEDLYDALRQVIETASNISSHGQHDDYVVGMWRMAHRYEEELKKRGLTNGRASVYKSEG